MARLHTVTAFTDSADAGFQVEHIAEGKAKTKTPDFKVSLPDGPLFVEVYTRNMHAEEAAALEGFHKAPSSKPGSDGVGFKEHVVHPMGKPKPGETTVENVASKIAGKKPRGEQVSQEHPAVLWLDLQDEDVWTLGERDVAVAWVGNDGEFFTTGIWHAFYGVKCLPLFEAHTIERRTQDGGAAMRFDGTFAQHRAWSAAVVSLPSAIVVLENPSARHRLPITFTRQATRLFRFHFGLSWVEFPAGTRPLADRVEDARQMLHALTREAHYRW